MHLGTRKGPRRERDRRCGRDEARPSNVARSVVVRRTGASASCPSFYPRVRRSSCTTFRCFRSSRASRGTTIFLSSTPKTFGANYRNKVRASDWRLFTGQRSLFLSFATSSNIQFRRCIPYFGRKAYGNLRVSFFSRHARGIISEIF